jgi:hypothetical protein
VDLRLTAVGRLRGRREEILEAVIHRALSVAPPSGREAPGYVEALRASIPAAVDYAFEVIELGEERVAPTPTAILTQAAASARSAVGLEVVMRRYAAGYSTLSDFLHQELRSVGGGSHEGYGMLQRELTALFDRLIVEVSEAYRCEEGRVVPSPRQRRLERIRRLLAGELVDPAGLEYPLEGSHLALIVSGPEPEATATELAVRLGRRLLVGEGPDGGCAAWLGGRDAPDPEALDAVIHDVGGEGLRLSLGEPGLGLVGWRRTRHQAEAAYLVAGRSPDAVVSYRDVALMAAALRDPDLAHFLAEAYLEPLGEDGAMLGGTLLTFLELNGNASSAAAALGVTRHTVAGRVRMVEERLGRPLGSCAAQLETALRLAELEVGDSPPSGR